MKSFILAIFMVFSLATFGQHAISKESQPKITSAKENNTVNDNLEIKLRTVAYHALSFSEPRYTASYGFMFDDLNMNNTPFGLTAGLEGNWGLAHGSGAGTVLIGPNIGWAFGNNNDIRLFMPITYGLSMGYYKDIKKTVFSHGLYMLPSVIKMLNKNFGLRAGFSFATDFSDVNAGFIVGLVF